MPHCATPWRNPTTCSNSGATTFRSRPCTAACFVLRTNSSTGEGSSDCAASTAGPIRRRRWRSSTGASAPTSGCHGPRTNTATCSGTSPTRTRASTIRRRAGNELGGIALPFHCDGSDLVGLMCLENGRRGGLSAVANSVRIHNQLVSERPDLAAALYDDLPNDFRGEQADGGKPYYLVPVFTEWEDRLFVRCIPPYIFASQRHPETPRLTDLQKEALAAVVQMADDPENHVLMDLLPGDMQFINNYHVFHGRTAYEDDRTTGHIRHLKRLWLETTVLESRPPYFANNRTHWSEHRTASRLQVN